MLVKIFEEKTRRELEKAIASWLSEGVCRDIVTVSYSHRRSSYSALVIYDVIPYI